VSRGTRVVIAVVALGAFVGLFANLTVTSARSLSRLSDERELFVASPTEGLNASLWPVGGGADVLKVLRPMLHPGERFWLSVRNPEADVTSYRLVSEYYLYPAVAVADEADADVVFIVGGDPAARQAGFTTLVDKDGIWVGRRS
jgi:hypothetical protein